MRVSLVLANSRNSPSSPSRSCGELYPCSSSSISSSLIACAIIRNPLYYIERLTARTYTKYLTISVLVMDQLNIHSPASLYQAFAPEEAKRLADRLEIHHTPKHGSWLNMAEIELSALGRDPGLRRGRLCPTGWVTGRRWSATSRPGSTAATPPPPGPIGSSLPRTPASSSVNSTPRWKDGSALGVAKWWAARRPSSRCWRLWWTPKPNSTGSGRARGAPLVSPRSRRC